MPSDLTPTSALPSPSSSERATPSIRDVASAAKVNMSTVSRFLNGKVNLRPETAHRIRSAVADLGYQPVPEHRRKGNRLRSRKKESVETVSLLLCGKFDLRWIADYSVAYAYLLEGVRHAAKAERVDLLLRHASDASELRKSLAESGVDGVLVLGDDPSLSAVSDKLGSHAVVKLLGEAFSSRWDTVTYSNIEASRMAARYLIQKGVKTAGILTAPAVNGLFAVRSMVFRIEMAAAGVQVVDLPALSFADLSDVSDFGVAEEIEGFVTAMLRHRPRVDGLFVTQDHQLRLLWPTLQRHGVEPCRQIHIIGCNNELPHLRSLFPRPASIDIRCADIGRIGVQQLLARIRKPEEPCRAILLPPILVPSQYEGI